MSLFARSLYAPDQSFAPLVRLLNDWDSYSREGQLDSGNHQRRHALQTFNPKFDVLETDNEYQLHGELGGIAKENVHLEFTDDHTLVVKGRVEKSYTAGDVPESAGAITEPTSSKEDNTTESGSHKATARDEKDEQAAGSGDMTMTKQQTQEKRPAYKYWLSERSVGEFSRVFQFPNRVERDEVTAGLDNGILSVKVPKAKKLETRRIDIA